MFELLTLMGGTAHFGVQAKALLVDTALLRGLRLLAGNGLQAQYFLARPGPKGDAVVQTTACRDARAASAEVAVR